MQKIGSNAFLNFLKLWFYSMSLRIQLKIIEKKLVILVEYNEIKKIYSYLMWNKDILDFQNKSSLKQRLYNSKKFDFK